MMYIRVPVIKGRNGRTTGIPDNISEYIPKDVVSLPCIKILRTVVITKIRLNIIINDTEMMVIMYELLAPSLSVRGIFIDAIKRNAETGKMNDIR